MAMFEPGWVDVAVFEAATVDESVIVSFSGQIKGEKRESVCL